MTSAKKADDKRGLRLVHSSAANVTTLQDDQDTLESELARDRWHMRRALVAKIVEEREREVAKTGAPRAALVERSRVDADAASPLSQRLLNAGASSPTLPPPRAR